MLENLFVMLFISGVVITVLAYYEEKVIWSILSAIIWMIIFANSLYIVVPGDTFYSEMGLNAFSLAFVFISIVMAISQFMGYSEEEEMYNKYRIRRRP